MLIPKYWEQPELLTDFVESVKMMNGGNENKEPIRTTGSRRLGDPRV
jgi:hypothetical protein